MSTSGAVPGPLLIGLPSTRLDARDRSWLRHPAVGGVVLFSRNVENPAQLRSLVAEIRETRDPRPLVCVDQEGGRVQRLRDGFTRLPPLGALGALHREDPGKALDFAYRHGRVMATEVLASGIDLSFAPVLDLDRGSSVIGNRSLGADPQRVIELGRAYLAGMRDAGMKSTGKHFPGHGSIAADSHTDDVVDRRSLEEIRATDLRPFRLLAQELDSLMIAHVTYSAVDDLPAGYSETWLGGVLRREMGYGGVVLSDDLGMHAAKRVGDLEQRTRLCLDAGCDLALVCQPEDVEWLLARLGEAALADASGAVARLYGRPTVTAEELDQAVAERIGEWRRWRRSLEDLNEQAWA